MNKKLQKINTSFNQILKDFQPNHNYQEVWSDLGDGRKMMQRFPFELPKELKIKYPFIVYLMFTEIYNYPTLPRFEKVAWEIPILYKGNEFVLAHRKFGFDITAFRDSDELKSLAVEAIGQIIKAIPLVEAMINPKIEEQIQLGNITLESKYSQIRNRYLFFRGKLEDKDNSEITELKHRAKNFSWKNFGSKSEALNEYNRINMLQNTSAYFLYAMIDSYFSLLEHISVLLIPFLSHIKVVDLDFERFIGENWKKKLQVILQHKSNEEAVRRIEILDEIKEQIRNPMSHGYFHKNGKSFFVHMKGLGAIPFTLTKSATKYKFSDVSPDYMPISTIIQHFDGFDNFLNTQRTRFGLKYIMRDLPVAFDKRSVTEYRRRMRTDNSTEKYINEMIRKLEDSMNMDW